MLPAHQSRRAVKLPKRIAQMILCAAICLPGHAQASDSSKIFQIGIFDGSSDEFARTAGAEPVRYVVGQSEPASVWPAKQPAASAEGAAGPASSRSIEFDLAGSIASGYRLHAALLIESRSVPSIRIGINGKYGTWYLDSGLSTKTGNLDDTFESLYVPADLDLVFSGRYFQVGKNIITIQVIDPDLAVNPDASLTYDAIELDSLEGQHASAGPAVAVVPTIYYKGLPGTQKELVNVFVSADTVMTRSDSVDLILAGQHYRQNFQETEDFGQQKMKFWVPEFPGSTPAQLEYSIGGTRSTRKLVVQPQKKWTLLLVPHIHLDVGFSDYQPKVAAIQTRAMDEGIDLAEQHPGFSFSVDGAWDLDQFLKTRSSADQQRAVAAMKEGQLFVPAQYADLLTGFPTAETLIRSLYSSARFSQIHGTPFNYANITDVPSYSWSYPSILAAAGLRYFLAGPNGHETRAPVLIQGRLNEQSPFWWVGPDGGEVLVWYARHYWEGGILFGVPPHADAGLEILPLFLRTYERHSYKASSVILYGTQGENTDLHPEQAELADKWNREFAWPRIRYSGFAGALKKIAAESGKDLLTVSGDGGPYWEDGIASTASLAAEERRNESRAPSVEKLATLAALVNPRVAADKADLDQMWTNMVLMDEHTWNAFDSVSDPQSDQARRQSRVKEMYALDAQQIGDFVARNSMANLAASIPAPQGSLVVFNTLGWKRSSLVGFDLERGHELVDSTTGVAVPVQIVRQSQHLLHVRFMAADIPGMGYKVFEIRPAQRLVNAGTSSDTNVLENRWYRVELDPEHGAVRSIYDKELHRELVNRESPYRFGQYLYVSGGDHRPNSLLQYRTLELEPKLQVDGAQNGHLISVDHAAFGSIARIRSEDTNTPAITTEIRLFDHEKKIEFVEEIDKTAVTNREAVYFAFPFAMPEPQFQYEIQNGVVDPAKDMYPGAGHIWFSVQHWVSAQQGGVSGTVMPLDTSLVTLGDIDRGAWPAQFVHRTGTIFCWAMNNYWSTNYNGSQGGTLRLRYVITSAASTNAASLSRMGWEEETPLELNEVTRQDKALPAPATPQSRQSSYLRIDDPALLLEDWKPAEDGRGTILRFLDLGGAERLVKVRIPVVTMRGAVQTDAVERDKSALKLEDPHCFQITIHPHEIATVRVLNAAPASTH